MAKKVTFWDSGGKEEIRKIPVVCNNCKQSVSVGGWIGDGKIILDSCPNCHVPFWAAIFTGRDNEKETEAEDGGFPITANIIWQIEGGMEPERNSKFGPMKQVTRLLMSVLNSGVYYFSHRELPVEVLYTTICEVLVNTVLPIDRIRHIFDLCSKRLNDEAVDTEPSVKSDDSDDDVIEPNDEDKENDQ